MATTTKRNARAATARPANEPDVERGKGPAVRPEKIARGKELLHDPEYPSPRVVQSVARILARKWTQPKAPKTGGATAKAHSPKASCTI
jgi:hypothetical protein